MTTGKFSSTEWKQVINAPQLVHHFLLATDRAAFFTKRIEAKALHEFLGSYRSDSVLVKAIIADQKDADDEVKASGEETLKMLEQVGLLVEARTDAAEGDAIRDFLMKAGETIAEAATEHLLNAKDRVSDAEEKSLEALAVALKATAADKRRRHAAAGAAKAKKQAEEQLKKEREAAAKREPDSHKQAEAAKQQAEAKEAKAEAESIKTAAKEAGKEAEEIYVVKKGDTLSGIALEVYGNAGRWREIFEANRDRIKKANLIRPGWKLRIPR